MPVSRGRDCERNRRVWAGNVASLSWNDCRMLLRLTVGFLEGGTSPSPVMLAMGILVQSWLHCFLLYAEAVSQPEGWLVNPMYHMLPPGSFVLQGDGDCSCKARVTGDACDTCEDGYFALEKSNYFGCQGKCILQGMSRVKCRRTNACPCPWLQGWY